ncbi:MAG: trimeric intracellular cation channel family protein [Planctomycetaceae bacterium]|nr:trimeric intracellular cation channel family protein [Planctomycetaceae bacterium]
MFQLIELIAVIAGAVYGVLLARRHQMDFVGAFSIAFICAFGGGTLRDLLLDRHPLFWIRAEHYPVVVFAIALVISFVRSIPAWVEPVVDVADALGLGLFSVMGATAAVQAGTSLFIASLLGVVTGTFGGVIGDVVCNKVPSLFRTAPLYATCAFGGCWLLFGLQMLPLPPDAAVGISVCGIVVVRLLAIRYQWRLPQYSEPEAVTPDNSKTP